MSDAIDEALARLHATDVEYASASGVDGLSNHGPMAVASLAEMGLGDRAASFVDAYLPRLRPLGDDTRARVARFESRLGAGDWRAPLRELLAPLWPGAVAAACHGWLRTAHAVQMLLARDTPARRREVAFGLASWEARFQTLPGSPGAAPERGLDVVQGLARVPIADEAARGSASLILDRVRAVDALPGFAESIARIDLDARPFDETVGALAAAGARLFVATPSARFVYLHAITSASALRLVAPILDDVERRRALGAIVHAVAALHATHADVRTARAAIDGATETTRATPDAIRRRASATLDDHDVKLAAAALREHAIAPRPELLTAAAIRLGL